MPVSAGGGKPCTDGELCGTAIHYCASIKVFSQSGKSVDEVERVVLEEFGRCMRQIISSAQSGMCSCSLALSVWCFFSSQQAEETLIIHQ